MENVSEFIGRFHPLLVHLPIGVLLIAALFIWLDRLGKISIPAEVIQFTIAFGALSAVASVATGLLLSDSGDYDASAVGIHKWMGISLAVVSMGLWSMSRQDFFKEPILKWGSLLVALLVLVTGHFGGSLTHGSGYLTGPLLGMKENGGDSPDLAHLDMKSAIYYNDVIQPLMEARCYSCHGSTKQKGGLRLDDPELILKGGKNGKVVTAGSPEESELIKRLVLPMDDEDHMPPKEKKQLSEQEKKWIELWIETGADFTKKITELAEKKQIDELLVVSTDAFELPTANVQAPNENLITTLTEQGISVSPVARDSHFLNVSFISIPKDAAALLPSLKGISANIISLKLNGTNVDDQALDVIDDLPNLMVLSLTGTKITDKSIDLILKMNSINTLNLEGTQVSSEAIKKLAAMPKLKYINVYKTLVRAEEHEALQNALPNVRFEFGGYLVPTLPTDTFMVKPKQ